MTQCFHNTPSLIGDSLLTEPALTALWKRTGEKSLLCVEPRVRSLFEENPAFDLIDEPAPGSIKLDCSAAFSSAFANNWYFALGFFEQLGMYPNQDDRTHFKIFNQEILKPRIEDCQVHQSSIVIAPFSVSCSVHSGYPANKTAPIEWWDLVVKHCTDKGYQVFSLGAANEPAIFGAINLRGQSFFNVARRLQKATLLITVETGILHLAPAVCKRVLYLNSATPPWFCAPDCRYEVVSSPIPNWDHTLVFDKLDLLLKEL